MRLYPEKQLKQERARVLSSKHEALSSNPRETKQISRLMLAFAPKPRIAPLPQNF
jgi:hypothetical protein